MFRDAAKALKAFTSVLIVACPCALALAAPLTHGTVQRLLARRKIFLRNALVIERMAAVDTIVLDKTGTLTTADARGVHFHGAELTAAEENGFRRWRGIPRIRIPCDWPSRSARRGCRWREFKETPGCGVEGVVGGNRILLGSQRVGWWHGGSGWWDARSAAASACSWQVSTPRPCQLAVFVAINGVLRGSFALENSLRPEVEQLIARLGGRFELALLSGDNEREAARFRKIFGGGAMLKFNQSPADKLNFIQELQQRGRTVMMVGDGLNDAGALKQADVGVAVVERGRGRFRRPAM